MARSGGPRFPSLVIMIGLWVALFFVIRKDDFLDPAALIPSLWQMWHVQCLWHKPLGNVLLERRQSRLPETLSSMCPSF